MFCVFMVKTIFSTLTNVNFDPKRFRQFLQRAVGIKKKAQKLYEGAAKKAGKKADLQRCSIAWWEGTDDLDGLIRKGQAISRGRMFHLYWHPGDYRA